MHVSDARSHVAQDKGAQWGRAMPIILSRRDGGEL